MIDLPLPRSPWGTQHPCSSLVYRRLDIACVRLSTVCILDIQHMAHAGHLNLRKIDKKHFVD